jgi:hypothetical protein
MMNRILNAFGRRPPVRRGFGQRYGRVAGGGLLPLLALFGWRNRDRIKTWYRSHYGADRNMPQRDSV